VVFNAKPDYASLLSQKFSSFEEANEDYPDLQRQKSVSLEENVSDDEEEFPIMARGRKQQ
jgi:FPC/CPF motif-containing protein YcgG